MRVETRCRPPLAMTRRAPNLNLLTQEDAPPSRAQSDDPYPMYCKLVVCKSVLSRCSPCQCVSVSVSQDAQCNGSIDLCSKQYNEVAYLTTHNAFNSDEDGLLFPNQTYNIASQLNDGVRGLMIDVYDHFGTPTAYHSVFALGTIPLSDLFNDIKTFLDNNSNEIVTIILECYVTANDIEDEINQSGLSNYLYTHNAAWPTYRV